MENTPLQELKRLTALKPLKELKKKIQGLKPALDDYTIYALLAVIDSYISVIGTRDSYTGLHCRLRVPEYLGVLTKEFKNVLKGDYLNALVSAATIHDLGKVGVSDVFLKGKDRLTEKLKIEQRNMHPIWGANIICNSLKALTGKSNRIPIFVLYHHWDYNGKGYPQDDEINKVKDNKELLRIIKDTREMKWGDYLQRKKKGNTDENPYRVGIGILKISDYLDSRTIRRSYGTPIDMDSAIEEIQDTKGETFHPDVVEVLKLKRVRDQLNYYWNGFKDLV